MMRLMLGAAAALFLTAGQAAADGIPSRGKARAPDTDTRVCSTSGDVGVTSDYVFRGFSKSNEEAAIQGGVNFACGRFYAGFWGSSVADELNPDGSEIKLYGGYKTTVGRFTIDLGLDYYIYPGIADDRNFVELKAGASTDVWQGGTVRGTIFYAPDYFGNAGDVITYEVGFAQTLPKFAIFNPTFSATYGYSDFQDNSDSSYSYWNVGVSLGFAERWSVDLRYWDSDIGSSCTDICDERFVATLKYTF